MISFLLKILEMRIRARHDYVHSLFMTGALRGTSDLFRETLLEELR